MQLVPIRQLRKEAAAGRPVSQNEAAWARWYYHDQRQDQGCEDFVEREIVRPHAKHHPRRGTANLADDTLLDDKAGRLAIQLLECKWFHKG